MECRNPICYNVFDPDTLFTGETRTRGRPRRYCSKGCWNRHRFSRSYSRPFALKSRYGMSDEEYQKMWTAQKGKCAICFQRESNSTNGTVWNLNVDHDHTSGKVRGLLCSACNRGIGALKDDPDLVERALTYLRAS